MGRYSTALSHQVAGTVDKNNFGLYIARNLELVFRDGVRGSWWYKEKMLFAVKKVADDPNVKDVKPPYRTFASEAKRKQAEADEWRTRCNAL